MRAMYYIQSICLHARVECEYFALACSLACAARIIEALSIALASVGVQKKGGVDYLGYRCARVLFVVY